jgi:glycosyltransferase involved in cell wall biosynthesis
VLEMKVAILNRERTWFGGDLVAIDATMLALRELGVDCWYGTERPLKDADLVHIFHCNFPWSRENFRLAEQFKKPFVVTPTFYPEDRGMTGEEIAAHLRRAAAVLPFSHTEGREMRAWIGAEIPYRLIPNGTATMFHSPDGWPERSGVAAAAARADDGKRWEVIRDACRELSIPFTLLTGLPQEELAAQYMRHKVFVSASITERMSLVIGEALCAGCRVLSTNANRGNEWYGPGLRTVDPKGSVRYFKEQIASAYNSTYWDWSPNAHARNLTWNRVAEQLVEVYEGIACS